MPPIWIIFPGSLVEVGATLWFILNILDVKINSIRFILLDICIVTLLLFAKIILQTNLFIHLLLGIFTYIVLIYMFTKVNWYKILIPVTLSYAVIIMVEPLTYFLAHSQFSVSNYNSLWLLTMLPHVIIFCIITLVIKKVRNGHVK
ncbi:MAG: hypothetical protein K9L56_07290 [Clostridiales bacterium]|nr:hypothetical protein [Clostridiales bacterium]